MIIVGLCGLAGSGKDTAADHLVLNRSFAKVSFADPLKRICRDVFGFDDRQLWGPSSSRNEPDRRYRRRPDLDPNVVADGELGPEFLSPRFALQTLGTEWGRRCYPPIWVEYALRIAEKLRQNGEARYTARRGLYYVEDRRERRDDEVEGVVIPDVRFANEVEAVRRAGGFVVRLVRPGAGLSGMAGMHPSEREQAEIPDSAFDAVVQNDSTIDALNARVDRALTSFGG
jgi:hypothetical protein